MVIYHHGIDVDLQTRHALHKYTAFESEEVHEFTYIILEFTKYIKKKFLG